jgi:putative oxidoreductase
MLPELTRYANLGLLLLRLMIAVVFIPSGWNHLKDPEGRSKSIGMSKGFTVFLGLAEVLGGIAVGVGFLTQIAALGLVLIMAGAAYKKAFTWHTGFWGEKSPGWHYDLMLLVMNLTVALTGGGRYRIWP